MKKYQLASLLWLISSIHGQNLVDIRTQTKNVDFSGAASTIPAKTGTVLPATCNPGSMFFNTSNPPGQNLYSCAPANTWTLIGSSTNGTVSTATSGQFGFYSAGGNTIVGHTLTASDIPALSYQGLLAFTGNGSKTASSTGSLSTNDCAKWDANGNIIDAGSPCASVASGTAGQFGFYSASGNALTPHMLVPSDIPALSYQSLLTFTGTGAKTVSATAAGTANNCAKWDTSGNVVDAGAPCGTSSGTTGITAPATTTTGNVPQFSNTAGTALSTGLGVVTSVGSPGSNSNIPTEQSVRAAIAAAGAFPSLVGGTNTAAAMVIGSGASLSASGTGTIAATSVPASGVTGLAPSATTDTTNASNIASGTLSAARLPASVVTTTIATGAGTKYASATAAGNSNNCAKWDANGNVVDAGAPCGTGSGTSGITAPATTTTGNVPQFSNTAGTALSTGMGVVTSLGSPGSNSNIPTEQSVRAAITVAGNFPSLAGGTNTAAAMVIGSGASLSATGTGTIAATSIPASGVTGLAPSATTDATNASNIASGTLSAARLPASVVTTTIATGAGTKYASATAAGASNNCAKWDANGNVVDAGLPCINSAFPSMSGGTNTTAALVVGSGASISATGTGTIAATSVPASGVTGLAASATTDTTNASNIASGTLSAARLPAGVVTTTIATGAGTKYASATGAGTSNNCAKWDANGNVVDAGAPCGTGSGTTGITGPVTTTTGNIPQFSNTAGTALSTGLGVVTSVGSPGSNSSVPTEQSVRTAITAASTFPSLAGGTNTAAAMVIGSGASLSATGTGTITATSVPASGVSGLAPSATTDTTNASNIASGTLSAARLPAGVVTTTIASGTGTKYVSATAAGVSNNCARWDANGNIVDAGLPCINSAFPSMSGGTNTTAALVVGSGASIAATGTGTIAATSVPASGVSGLAPSATTDTTNASNIASGTLSAARLPAGVVTTTIATGTGTKYVSATAAGVSNNCARWDANGNIVDAGQACSNGNFPSLGGGTNTNSALVVGSGASLSATGTGTIAATSVPASGVTGLAPSATTDTTNATNIASGTLSLSRLPQSVLTTGNGSGTGVKFASVLSPGVSNDCVKWDASGNIIDAGAPCGSGSGSSGAFNSLSSGTNTSAAMVIGAGASLSATSTGTIAATSVPASGVTGLAPSATTDATNATNIASGTLSLSRLPQSVLTTGNGSGTGVKFASVLAPGVSNDCAKWDASGNIIDAGAPCGSGSGGSSAFNSLSSGTNTSAAMVIGAGASLSATSTGTIVATSVPASGVTGLSPSATTDATNASNISSGTLSAARLPASAVTTSISTGSGTKYASATAAGVSNNCAKWDANGNVVDAGSPCGSGGGSSLSVPSATTVTNIPQYSNTTGTALSTGLGLVTTLGNPGLDTNVPSEKAIRTAIAAISVASGSLPSQTGSTGYLVSNGSSANWGDLVTGPSGALCAGTGCSGGTTGIVDIVTSVVPRVAAANTFTGLQTFTQPMVGVVGSAETVTFSATPTFSNTLGVSLIVMTANISGFTLSAGINGQDKTLTFCQDTTGGRTVSGVPSNVRGFMTIPGSQAANACNSQHFKYYLALSAWLADSTGVIGQ